MRAVPSAITLACTVEWCPAVGRRARVYPRLVALGVVEMPRWLCVHCGCELARTDVEEDPVAKITVHGGPTDERSNPPAPTPTPAQPAPVAEAPTEPAFPEPPFDEGSVGQEAGDPPPLDVPAEQAEATPPETEPVAEVPVEAPAPKRRGRPRKAV